MCRYKILFIDDEANDHSSSRKQLIDTLVKDTRFDIEAVHPIDFQEILDRPDTGTTPYNLIIVDYKLGSKQSDSGSHYHSNGYAVTSLCKEKYPETPVYLISQILNKDVTLGEHYDKMLSHTFLTKSEGRDLLFSDCIHYATLNEKDFTLKELFRLPKDDIDVFYQALPIEFKNIDTSKQTRETHEVLDKEPPTIRLAKWVNQVFLSRSGPLIDEDELAVLFGLKKSDKCLSTLKERNEIKECLYTGIFSNSNHPKWWAQSIFNFASSLVDTENQIMPWKQLPTILGMPDDCLSTCVVCGEKNPECIAYDSDDLPLEQGKPAHWKCTSPSENHEDIPGFNPTLILHDL
ncbi:MAG: response regulator [Methyloprofundus sp.]|nr:response regulator [Methyloprofundus sp.]